MQMVGVSTSSRFQSPLYVQSQVFRRHCERFSKIFPKSKVLRNVWNYYANQTILNLGTIPNFRNHCEIFGTIPRFRNLFYTWRVIFRKRSTWCPDRLATVNELKIIIFVLNYLTVFVYTKTIIHRGGRG